MSHWKYQNIFPEDLIQLNLELQYHPELMESLATHEMGEWEIKIAHIAAYCDVVLDGSYTPEDMEKLAKILKQRLILMRKDNRGILILN